MAQLAIYGSVAMLRMKCPSCGDTALCIDRIMQCCDHKIPAGDESVRVTSLKRECTTQSSRAYISAKKKREILEAQDGACIYCGVNLDEYEWSSKSNRHHKTRVHYDHFVPWSYSGDNTDVNMYASCSRCNLVKGSKIFDTLEAARAYIVAHRQAEGGVRVIENEPLRQALNRKQGREKT